MGAYRYLLFPKHQQPTAEEAEELKTYHTLLKGRYAIGYERKTEALAILFEQQVFTDAMADEGFEMLVRKWQVHGCEMVDKLKFVKDPSSLKPTHIHERHLSPNRIVAAKKYMAEEAIAKSLLGVQRTLERMSWLERVGRSVPYALIAIGTLVVIATGFYVHHRMDNASRERRTRTIERVTTDAMGEPLDAVSPDFAPANATSSADK